MRMTASPNYSSGVRETGSELRCSTLLKLQSNVPKIAIIACYECDFGRQRSHRATAMRGMVNAC